MTLLFVGLFLSLVFLAVGYLLNEGNAPILMSGYNTLTREEQAQIDIRPFLAFHKKFHVWLAVTFFSGFVLLWLLGGKNAAGIFAGVYPIVAYIWFLFRTRGFNERFTSRRMFTVVLVIMLAVLTGVILMMWSGFKSDQLTADKSGIHIAGIYSESVSRSNIKRVALVDNLPKIKYRVDGFALGDISKGYFRTMEGEEVKLVLNRPAPPYLLIERTDGLKIFYSDKSRDNTDVYHLIRASLPEACY
jgi:hypothetical protein